MLNKMLVVDVDGVNTNIWSGGMNVEWRERDADTNNTHNQPKRQCANRNRISRDMQQLLCRHNDIRF